MLINGVPATAIDARDRGLHYGDGLFETVAVRAGQARHLERHLRRLALGCAALALPVPEPGLVRTEVATVARGRERAVVKIILTRGAGGRGYRPPVDVQPTRIVAAYPWPELPADAAAGVRIRVCSTVLSCQPRLGGVKHLNRLDQVLARSEWSDPGIVEGLMCDISGDVIEATSSNVFIGKNGQLVTPDVSRCGVAGIMRERVLEGAAALAIPCDVTRVTRAQVRDADEVFLTNSVIGIWPVIGVDRQRYAPGELMRRLRTWIEETE